MSILEILKNMPMGAHLWSPIFGNCTFVSKHDKDRTVRVVSKNGTVADFGYDGKRYPTGECLLFPSERMTDWERFFLPGDIVEAQKNDPNCSLPSMCVFERFTRDDYTVFAARDYYSENGDYYASYTGHTEDFHRASQKNAEEFAVMNDREEERETEKQAQPFKPFDKVLVRDFDTKWHINIFEHYNSKDWDAPRKYECIIGTWSQCIPYEGNEHLLGTTNLPTDKEADL